LPGLEPYFVRPGSLEEALSELADPGAMALGGGTSVVMFLKNGMIQPDKLVFVGGLGALSGVTRGPAGDIRLGGTTTLRDLARSPVVGEAAPALATAASQVGNPRVRAVATVGGALAHADPRQDLPPVLLALDASATVAGRGSERNVPLAEFFRGFMETAVREDELITEVVIPPAGQQRHSVYARFTPASEDDYPTVGVAVSVGVAPDGTVQTARVALGGVADTPILVPEANGLLAGGRPGDADVRAVAEAAEAACRPTSDRRGSTSYKKAMAVVWTRRAVLACLEQAQ
jgi:carbon-monoxide dehydrogenase medium subunit